MGLPSISKATDIFPRGHIHGQLQTPQMCTTSVHTTVRSPLGMHVTHMRNRLALTGKQRNIALSAQSLHVHPLMIKSTSHRYVLTDV